MFFKHDGSNFNPDSDISSLKEKVIVITGGNNGLGKECALRLSKHDPARIYICSRDHSRGLAALDDIRAAVPSANLDLLDMDLNSLSSVAEAAKVLLSKEKRLDILINNAGVMATTEGKTEDGYEKQLGINHLGHALLIKLLLPTMLETAKHGNDVRIVTVASHSHERFSEGLCLEPDKLDMSFTGAYSRYGRSKLANVLFARGLAVHHPEILSVSLHPGTIQTNLLMGWADQSRVLHFLVNLLGSHIFDTVEDGAKNTLWCATVSREKVKNGSYYMPVGKEHDGSKLSRDEAKREELWQWTERELKKKGY